MCQKKRFANVAAARRSLRGRGAFTGSRRQREYFCHQCRGWHLTSIENAR